ncbi:hypothetical protein DM800_20125 [Bacillus sp. AY18-3]|uniref:hypothetical protein n=1 Tax=Bacillus sp. AY18-3 TaxID=2217814 RepID=UPI0011CCBF46|nr:hypothetical protein [Bacillus sp. AY18-3]TXR62590.1 hypothetical protein DM800_20125 [Bacillus sp. AY18-3]
MELNQMQSLIVPCFCFVVVGIVLLVILKKIPENHGNMTGKDVDKVVKYMKDHKLESCSMNIDANKIEIFSEETGIIRMSSRKARVGKFIERKIED